MAASYGIRPPAYRLPDATHPGSVLLQVADLERSIDYYQVALGLKLRETTGDGAVLGPQAGDRALVRLKQRAGARRARGEFGLYHFAILVPDRPTLGRFVSHLRRIEARVGMADHLVSEALYLTDPDGLGIEVYADRPRDTWRVSGEELAMASDPLNVRDLVAAADRPWDGMPEGTVMGHVHLHVGDLGVAEGFYHEQLGLDKTAWSYPGALFLSAGGYHHHLGLNTWSRGPSASEDQARLLEWQLIVPGRREEVLHDPWGTALRITPA